MGGRGRSSPTSPWLNFEIPRRELGVQGEDSRRPSMLPVRGISERRAEGRANGRPTNTNLPWSSVGRSHPAVTCDRDERLGPGLSNPKSSRSHRPGPRCRTHLELDDPRARWSTLRKVRRERPPGRSPTPLGPGTVAPASSRGPPLRQWSPRAISRRDGSTRLRTLR
jgi:hypothetical protein